MPTRRSEMRLLSGLIGLCLVALSGVAFAQTVTISPSPLATNAVKGVMEGDAQTVACAAGVCSVSTADATFSANHQIAATDMGGQVVMNGSSLTVTIPAISSTVLAANMKVRVTNMATTPVLIATTPTINNYPNIGAASGCTTATTCYIPPLGGIDIVSNGTSLDAIPLGESAIKYKALTWGPGQNLSTNALPLVNFPTYGHIILSVTCTPEVVAGAAATIDLYMAASATALGSGTKLTSTSCNANTGAATDQTGLLGATSIVPAGDRLGFVSTGWTSTSGSGVVTVKYQ
jgi:hypothetical protein